MGDVDGWQAHDWHEKVMTGHVTTQHASYGFYLFHVDARELDGDFITSKFGEFFPIHELFYSSRMMKINSKLFSKHGDLHKQHCVLCYILLLENQYIKSKRLPWVMVRAHAHNDL
jgi:hypothetical protein